LAKQFQFGGFKGSLPKPYFQAKHTVCLLANEFLDRMKQNERYKLGFNSESERNQILLYVKTQKKAPKPNFVNRAEQQNL